MRDLFAFLEVMWKHSMPETTSRSSGRFGWVVVEVPYLRGKPNYCLYFVHVGNFARFHSTQVSYVTNCLSKAFRTTPTVAPFMDLIMANGTTT